MVNAQEIFHKMQVTIANCENILFPYSSPHTYEEWLKHYEIRKRKCMQIQILIAELEEKLSLDDFLTN